MLKRFCTVGLALAGLLLGLPAHAQTDKIQLQLKLKDTAAKEKWIYDDIDAGFAQAKKSGKPLLVVLRCVP